jgi:hypothetical protein
MVRQEVLGDKNPHSRTRGRLELLVLWISSISISASTSLQPPARRTNKNGPTRRESRAAMGVGQPI